MEIQEIENKCDGCNLEVEIKKGEKRVEKWNKCEADMDVMNGMKIHMKENDLRGEECKEEHYDKNEFGVHNEKKLVEEIIRDALRLEESLRLYMTGKRRLLCKGIWD